MNEYKFLKYFKQFVDEINLENGRNYKLSILEKYKDNDCVKYFLQQVFDPFIVFGISDKKLNKDVGHQSGVIWLDYPEDSAIFEYLKEHNTGTDKDIWTVQQFRKRYESEDLVELFDKVVTKNLSLGISAATINKVFGKNTISEFNVMLANKYFDKPEVVEGKEFAITTKIDGMRCIMLKENGNVTFWSRQGQQIEGLVDLEEEAKLLPDNICLDGELIAKETSLEDTYKNTMKTARTKDAEKHNLKMMVFDCMKVSDFKEQINVQPYSFRRLCLNHIWNKQYRLHTFQCGGIEYDINFASTNNPTVEVCKSVFSYFELLPILYQGTDTSKIIELLDEQTSKGEEGVMINIIDAPYEFKRTNQLLKVKKFQDIDLEIVDYFEGNNEFSGMLGGFIVRYKNGNTIRVGSGIDKDFRIKAWENPQDYIGQVITVKYFEETQNADGCLSLRFPVFKGFRFDKGADC